MSQWNQDYRNRDMRSERDYQHIDPDYSRGRRGENQYDERNSGRQNFSGRYTNGGDTGYRSDYGYRGDPEYSSRPGMRSESDSGRFDYEREDRQSWRPMHQQRPAWEERGNGGDWTSPGSSGGWSQRGSGRESRGGYEAEPREWRGQGSDRGEFRGSEGGEWSRHGWTSGSPQRRESSRGFGRPEDQPREYRSDSSHMWARGSSMGGTFAGRSQSDSYSTQYPTRERGMHFGKGPKGYRRSDDRIREDVNEQLKQDDTIDASDIVVQVREGIVTLTGEVDSRRAKRAAEECVERLPGVEDVTNQLRVRSDNKESNSSSSSSNASQTQKTTGTTPSKS